MARKNKEEEIEAEFAEAFEPVSENPTSPEEEPKKKRGRPPGTKNKQKQESPQYSAMVDALAVMPFGTYQLIMARTKKVIVQYPLNFIEDAKTAFRAWMATMDISEIPPWVVYIGAVGMGIGTATYIPIPEEKNAQTHFEFGSRPETSAQAV